MTGKRGELAVAWFTKTPPAGIAIPRLVLAAHEIGHLIAFQDAGIRVLYSAIEDGGDTGGTYIDDPDGDQHHGYLVGLAAGSAAEKYWCDIYGQRLPDHCREYEDDRALYRQHRRQHRDAPRLSWRSAENLARKTLRDNAKRFRQLTEQLAVDGKITP